MQRRILEELCLRLASTSGRREVQCPFSCKEGTTQQLFVDISLKLMARNWPGLSYTYRVASSSAGEAEGFQGDVDRGIDALVASRSSQARVVP